MFYVPHRLHISLLCAKIWLYIYLNENKQHIIILIVLRFCSKPWLSRQRPYRLVLESDISQIYDMSYHSPIHVICTSLSQPPMTVHSIWDFLFKTIRLSWDFAIFIMGIFILTGRHRYTTIPNILLMCKRDVISWLMHWGHASVALNHRYALAIRRMHFIKVLLV